MRRSTLAATLGGTTFGLAAIAAGAALGGRRARLSRVDRLLHLQADDLIYREVYPGASMAVLRGDPEKGPHVSFTRFGPGLRVPRHTHSHEITIVVLRGAYLYGTDEGEIRVGPGSFFVVPGGVPHWSGGDPREGALFLELGQESFDLNLLQ